MSRRINQIMLNSVKMVMHEFELPRKIARIICQFCANILIGRGKNVIEFLFRLKKSHQSSYFRVCNGTCNSFRTTQYLRLIL